MRVEVTAEDIAMGKRRDACCCPVARALRRATGQKWAVDGEQAFREDGDDSCWTDLPAAAKQFVLAFDAGEPVEPVAFEFRPETEAAP